MNDRGLAYLDASAFVKLIVPEPESGALEAEMGSWPQAVASEVLEIEAKRVTQRLGGSALARTDAALRRITLVPIDAQVRALASAAKPPSLRTLDAIHLATALTLESELGAFFAYDRRLARAAQNAGLEVLGPR